MKKAIGIDIGGTKCAAVLGELDAQGPRILSKRTVQTRQFQSPQELLSQLAQLVYEQAEGDLSQFHGIGISCGGPLDSRRGLIQSPTHLPGWDNIPVVDFFSERLGMPAYLQNDANACAVAEWKYGAGRGCRDMVFLTFGTGLGAGLILNGRLYNGCCDMAGEVGHIRMEPLGPAGYGKLGSLEGFCSGDGIALFTQMKLWEQSQRGVHHPLQDMEITAQNVFELARQGDSFCLSICQSVGEYFGRGLAIMIDLLNPERIVAGSIFTRQYDILYPAVKAAVEREALQRSQSCCRIVPAALGESLGDIAALSLAMGTHEGSWSNG